MKIYATVLLAGFAAAHGTAGVAQEAGWAERIDFNADARLRYEGIDEAGVADRDRMRFRVRLNLAGDVSEDVRLVLRFATGGDNPVSTNQTFGDGFSTKDIGIDRAYIEWTASDQITLLGGKVSNPLYRPGGSQLIWDSDLNPEGVAAKLSSGALFATLALFSAEERSAADDSLTYAAQAGLRVAPGDGMQLTAGFGYIAYTDTIGNSPFYDGSPNGNTVDANGNYLFEYRNIELFAEYDMSVRDWPLKLYAHATRNEEVSREDTAWAVGAQLGAARKQGSVQYSWAYQDVEADAVVATFNDSNFGGGGTDATGHILRARYMLRDTISIGGSLFVNEVDRFQGIEHDYDRIQLDLEFKFD